MLRITVYKYTLLSTKVCVSHQYLQQLLQVTGDERVIFVQRPAALLRVVTVTRQIPEDHLQPLLVVTHLSERQRRALILRRQRV